VASWSARPQSCPPLNEVTGPLPGTLDDEILHGKVFRVEGIELAAGLQEGRSEEGICDVCAVSGMELAIQLSTQVDDPRID